MAIEKWLAITSVGLFAMFAGEMISVYNFMNTVEDDSIVAQGFQPDPKLIQFVSIGVAPAGILAAVVFIMSRNYGSKQIGSLIIVIISALGSFLMAASLSLVLAIEIAERSINSAGAQPLSLAEQAWLKGELNFTDDDLKSLEQELKQLEKDG